MSHIPPGATERARRRREAEKQRVTVTLTVEEAKALGDPFADPFRLRKQFETGRAKIRAALDDPAEPHRESRGNLMSKAPTQWTVEEVYKGVTQADLDRGEELAKEHGWGEPVAEVTSTDGEERRLKAQFAQFSVALRAGGFDSLADRVGQILRNEHGFTDQSTPGSSDQGGGS
jgi:hypothetical protein